MYEYRRDGDRGGDGDDGDGDEGREGRWGYRIASRSLWQLALSKVCSCGSKYLKTSARGTIEQWGWEKENMKVQDSSRDAWSCLRRRKRGRDKIHPWDTFGISGHTYLALIPIFQAAWRGEDYMQSL